MRGNAQSDKTLISSGSSGTKGDHMPSWLQVQQAFEFLDHSFKFEMIYDGVSQAYMWISIIEVICFLFNIVTFVMSGTSAVWYAIFFLLFHMVRSSVGFYITYLLPPSHEITRKIGYKGNV